MAARPDVHFVLGTEELEALLRQGLGPLFQIRHHELAALAGTSRETVSRVLHALAAEGVVRLGPGTVEVREAALLEEIAFGLA